MTWGMEEDGSSASGVGATACCGAGQAMGMVLVPTEGCPGGK